MTTGKGIVYVATKEDRYVEEAFLSGESVKRQYSSLSITLFTDRPEHELCSSGVFDRVETIAGSAGVRSPWSDGQLNRLRCLRRTPYDRTLHLDTDTFVLTTELMSLFAVLDRAEVAMVETCLHDSFSRYYFGRRLFNAGLVLYSRTERVWRWLEAWEALSERNFRLSSLRTLPPVPFLSHVDESKRRELLCMDQISLAEVFTPEVNTFDLLFEVLERSWNHRGPLPGDENCEIRILHRYRLLATEHEAELSAAVERWRSGKMARNANA
jgi:hypothetical protein